MFYSHDILGRKTPLGAIWTLAHGKKLSKGKIIKIDLLAIIKEILQPNVPHSLRLQAIMINGVVRVYERQTLYLLEELQGMVQQVAAMATGTTAEEGPKGSAKPTNLSKSKQSARVEAITLPRAAAGLVALAEEDALDAATNNTLPALADDLFVLTLEEATPAVSGAGTEGGSAAAARDALAAAMQQHPSFLMAAHGLVHEEPHTMEWQEQEEMFEVPCEPLDEQLLLPPEATWAHAAEQLEQAVSPPGVEPPPSPGHAAGRQEQEEWAPPAATATREQGGDLHEVSEDTALCDSILAGGEALGPHPLEQPPKPAKRASGAKRKAGAHALVLDSLDNLLIRGAVYREWTVDYREVLASPGRQHQRRRLAGSGAGAGAGAEALLLAGRPAVGGAQAWCEELMGLFRAAAKPLAAESACGAAPKRGEAAQRPWLTVGGDGAADAAGGGGGAVAAPGGDDAGAGDVMMWQEAGEAMMVLPEEEQDLLGDLPFTDLEAERLRAARTPSDAGARLAALTRQGSGTSPGMPTGRSSRRTTASGSTLAPGTERSMPLAREGSGDLEGMLKDIESPLHFGGGALEDLLPDVGGYAARAQPGSGAALGSAAAAGGGGGGSIAAALGASLPSSQFPLLVESATQGWTVPASQLEATSAQTAMVVSIFRSRLLLQATAEDEADGVGGAGADPQLSFLALAQQLSRSDAAKLFYQLCVTATSSHIMAAQAAPYGDITIRPGRLL